VSILKIGLGVVFSSLVAIATLHAGSPTPAQAGGSLGGNVLVPSSSIQRPEDSGVRMHTNHLILVSPAGGLDASGGMTPAQVRSFYGMPASGGHGVIVIVDAYDYPTALSDFNTFSSHFGLPVETSNNPTAASNTVFQVVYAGGVQPGGDAGWSQEAALDIEWAHAMAPKAKIVLMEAASNNFGDLLAAVDLAAAFPGAAEVSMSWSSSEFPFETAYDSHFNVAGPIFFASSGDTGGLVGYPSCSPFVVAVGGTSVATSGAGVWSGETAWNSGGGGNSAYEMKPSWQAAVSMTGSHRGVPDISADADPYTGVAVYDSTPNGGEVGWMVFGGTSVSCPCVAGMVNLAGATYASGTQFLQTLYLKESLVPCPFRDITVGNNGFPALVGWDYATGVGTPQGTGSLSPNTVSASITTPASGVVMASGAQVAFSGSATDSSSSAVLSYAWTFGDGASAAGASASHVYSNLTTASITYPVTLTVTDNTGSSGSCSINVTVTGFSISVTSGSVGLLVGRTAVFVATVSGAVDTSVLWSTTTGSTISPGSPSSSATFAAAGAGTYTVTAAPAADPAVTTTISVDVHNANFMDTAVSGMDVLDLVGHWGQADPSLAMTGGGTVGAPDLSLILQQLGW